MVWLFSVLLGSLLAVALVVEPAFTLSGVVAIGLPLLGLFIKKWSPSTIFLSILGVALFGYAFLGRGFAYLGISPFYVGEFILVIGLVATIFGIRVSPVARSPVVWLLFAYMAWGALGTLPYVGTFGLVTFRDAVVWGYAVFAILASAALLDSGLVLRIPVLYSRILPYFLLWVPVAIVWSVFAWYTLPHFPGSEIPILNIVPGDAGCHLAGAAAFLLLGSISANRTVDGKRGGLRDWFLWLAWTMGFIVSASQGRSGLLANVVVFFLVLTLVPSRRWWKVAVLFGFATVGFVFLNYAPELDRPRTITPKQIAKNLVSIVGNPDEHLDDNKNWRIIWWKQIVDDTLFGKDFWLGKGYGYDLSEDYSDTPGLPGLPPLRSPHNSHITILARGGVPGALLWLGLQGLFASRLLKAFFSARRARDKTWAAIFVWVLAYWAAFMVIMNFSVTLENPQGGIWFWSLFGFGIAALENYQNIRLNDAKRLSHQPR